MLRVKILSYTVRIRYLYSIAATLFQGTMLSREQRKPIPSQLVSIHKIYVEIIKITLTRTAHKDKFFFFRYLNCLFDIINVANTGFKTVY